MDKESRNQGINPIGSKLKGWACAGVRLSIYQGAFFGTPFVGATEIPLTSDVSQVQSSRLLGHRKPPSAGAPPLAPRRPPRLCTGRGEKKITSRGGVSAGAKGRQPMKCGPFKVRPENMAWQATEARFRWFPCDLASQQAPLRVL